MIAYNYYIKFIPELKNDKKVEGSFSDVLTVRESFLIDLDEKLLYEMIFFNNQGRELMLYSDMEFSYTQKGQLWAFEVKDVVTFFWYSGTLSLEYIKHDNFTEKLLEYWCLHSVLPIFFTVEETYDFLHAGAVEIDGTPILFIAESFGGKSTMTDFFMKKGHTMISDDKVGTYEKEGQFFAVPSHPHHRPYRNKEDMGYYVQNYANIPKQMQIIYKLEKVEPNGKIEIKEIFGIKKFKLLRASSETNLCFLISKRFEYLMRMANVIQVFSVSVPWDLEKLKDIHGAILEHKYKVMV